MKSEAGRKIKSCRGGVEERYIVDVDLVYESVPV
jgi:hypothetical protein